MTELVLCWHFHQPDYRGDDGVYRLPWTYLHAFKDYSDMAAHLEAHPGVRAVVNFVPVLLDQLADYAEQFRSGEVRDPLLAALIDPQPCDTLEKRRDLVAACFRLNRPTMMNWFAGYRALYTQWKEVEIEDDAALLALPATFFSDLVTWYHLAWSGESVRRATPLMAHWLGREDHFSLAERQQLFAWMGAVVSGIIPRFKALLERGQIEISTTPHSHPILPLLLDFTSAQAARPGLPLPGSAAYPGGAVRAEAHVAAAIATHTAYFGVAPQGCWPAEGGVSEAALTVLHAAGLRWAASGGGVLAHTRADLDLPDAPGWRVGDQSIACFFRDDHLSDLIGFEYQHWHSNDAVRHFVHAVEAHGQRHSRLATVILDGENAWEYYPYNGWHFLDELYTALETHATVTTTTFAAYLDAHAATLGTLPHLVAGSWVYGDFTTWIGDPAKNRAWDLLCAAKRAYDAASPGLSLAQQQQAERVLCSCESSDWFWWLGDYNPSESVGLFDALFRHKLALLYAALAVPEPATLALPLARGGGAAESGGVMRR
ncbi:MAG: glycoside hydrolase [Betaproteobacteria bacterium]|nr:MAG: glycoside hydrolase [Betaproteobacteria bacterium]